MKNIGILGLFMIILASCVSKKSLEYPIGSKKGYTVEEYINLEMKDFSGFYGFSMENVLDSSISYSINGEKVFDPASNIKFLTLFAAVKYLDDTLNTFRYFDVGGRRYLMPLGDPSFLHPDFDNKEMINFLKRGPDTLIIDLSRQNEIHRYGSGWSWDDYMYDFSAERSILPMYGNTVRFYKKDGDLVAVPGDFEVETVSRPLKYIYERAQDKNSYVLRNNWAGVNPYNVPFIWSGELVRKWLGDISGKVVVLETSSNNAGKYQKNVGGVERDVVLRKMFRESNNFLAEQLMINIGYDKLNSKSAELSVYHVDKVDLKEKNLGAYKWVDGSGLSPYNRMSPDFAVNFISYLMSVKKWEELKEYFPVPGEEGSMDKWEKQEERYLWAKTGNKTGISNLSGVLEGSSGQMYIFSIMTSNFTELNKDVQAKMENVLKRLRRDL